MLLRYSWDVQGTEKRKHRVNLRFHIITGNVTAAFVHYLMFLPAFALLLNLLLFLQFLCDPGLSQRLTLAALVGLSIERGL